MTTTLPGAGPEEIEAQVTKKLPQGSLTEKRSLSAPSIVWLIAITVSGRPCGLKETPRLTEIAENQVKEPLESVRSRRHRCNRNGKFISWLIPTVSRPTGWQSGPSPRPCPSRMSSGRIPKRAARPCGRFSVRVRYRGRDGVRRYWPVLKSPAVHGMLYHSQTVG